MVIHIKRISVDDAVEIISNSVRLERFQTTPDSKEQMNDLYLAAAVRASLLDIDEDVEVVAQKGEVTVRIRSPRFVQKGLTQHIKDIVKKATYAKDVKIETFSTSPLGIWTVIAADKKLN